MEGLNLGFGNSQLELHMHGVGLKSGRHLLQSLLYSLISCSPSVWIYRRLFFKKISLAKDSCIEGSKLNKNEGHRTGIEKLPPSLC